MTRSAPASSAYDEDFFTWTQDQAAAIRFAGLGSGVLGTIDVEHVAEEIEDLGKRDLREVTSFLRLLLFHILKVAIAPDAPSTPHWRSEAREFQLSASRGFSPGMRRLIDVAELWQEAVKRVNADRHDVRLPPIAAVACPYTLDDLLSDAFDLDHALARVASTP